MNINKSYKGFFWIPDEPKNYKCGLLQFLHETAYVDLFDSFDIDPFNSKSKRRTKFLNIYGVLENGRFCILNECDLSLTGGLGGLTSTLINFHYLYYSSNRDLIEKKVEFSKIEFDINTLFHWGGKNSIESYHNKEDNLGLSYNKTPADELIFSNELYDLKLNHTTSIPITTYKKKLLVEQDTSLILRLKLNEDILKDFKFIEKIHDLFILFNAGKVEINNVFKLTTIENEEYFFCYSNIKRFRSSKGHQIHEFGNLFTYRELNELTDVNELFRTWFSLYQTLSYPIELVTKCLSDISMNRQHKFMNLMYGLEIIHDKDLNNDLAKSYFHKKDNKLIDEMKSLITEDNRVNMKNFIGKLRARLENNRKLHEKFNAFFVQLKIPVLELFKEPSEVFVDKIVNTRNNFAHVSQREPSIGIEELNLYNIKLEAILLFIFYQKLGLPSDKIKLKIKMHNRFQKVIN